MTAVKSAQALDKALLSDILTARECLDGFWNEKVGTFVRDSNEVNSAGRPTQYYPTATFVCSAMLHEAGLVPAKSRTTPAPPTLARIEYQCEQFLKKLKRRQLSEAIAASEINAPKLSWNISTSAWAIRALTAIERTIEERAQIDRMSTDEAADWKTWLAKEVDCQSALVVKHLEDFEGGSVLNTHESVHLALTYGALRSVRRAYVRGLTKRHVSGDVVRRIEAHAEGRCYKAISMYSAGLPAQGGLVEAAYAAAVLHELDPEAHSPFAARVLDLVCKALTAAQLWPLARISVSTESRHTMQISTIELAGVLAQLSWRLVTPDRRLLGDSQDRIAAFQLLHVAIQRSMVSAYRSGRRLAGWGNEHMFGRPLVETWVTAHVLGFLTNFRRYVQSVQQERVLLSGSYAVTWPQEMDRPGRELDLSTLQSSDKDTTNIEQIRTIFIDQVTRNRTPVSAFAADEDDQIELPRKDRENVSLVLYGPPGTAKTSIARGIAKALHWPLLTVTPSVFLEAGSHSIDARAGDVFADMMLLERIVLLFDECDELFRVRPGEGHTDADRGAINGDQLSEAALITSAMLPRIKELHDRGKLIFIFATNRLDAMSPAIKREGRFDRLFKIDLPGELTIRHAIDTHPEWKAMFVDDDEKELCKQLTRHRHRPSFDQVQRLMQRLAAKGGKRSAADGVSEFEKLLAERGLT